MKNNPKKWSQVYPQGTKAGDEEQLFFIGKDRQSGLARHPSWDWRSTAALTKESGLPRKRVEAIITKYVTLGLVFASPNRPDHWAYWERVPDMLLPDAKSVAKADQEDRIDDHINDDLLSKTETI
jgi:hypothetical protein